mgnify:CR=1 FL=1
MNKYQVGDKYFSVKPEHENIFKQDYPEAALVGEKAPTTGDYVTDFFTSLVVWLTMQKLVSELY